MMTRTTPARRLLAGIALLSGITLLGCTGCGVQPSGVIVGLAAPSGPVVPAEPTRLYLVSNGLLSLVERDTGRRLSSAETVALLSRGPTDDERSRGVTSEVPPDAGPVDVTFQPAGRVVVTLSTDARSLSTMAVDQIVCTVDAATTDRAPGLADVILIGRGQDRGPQTCPLRG